MHGCSLGTVYLVHAEVDSMGGVVEGGVGTDTDTSPRRVAIEKAQAELRQEYDVREERKRELDFLEKGGNPLDFKFGPAASVSVQSTSLTDQHPEQIVTSEAKGSFALTASPHGDSVESSGRLGVPMVSEPNIADNLLLFAGDNESLEGEKNSLHPSKRKLTPEQSSQRGGGQNAKESEDSGIIRLVKNQAYARRNRSRSVSGGHGSSVSTRHGSKDLKVLEAETKNQKGQNISSKCNSKSKLPNGDVVFQTVTSGNQFDTSPTKGGVSGGKSDVAASNTLQDKPHNQQSEVHKQKDPVDLTFVPADLDGGKELVGSAGVGSQPSAAAVNTENRTKSFQLNGFSSLKKDRKGTTDECTKGLDSESSCTQPSVSLGNNDNDLCNITRNFDSNGNAVEQSVAFEKSTDLENDAVVKERKDLKATESGPISDDRHNSAHQDQIGTDNIVKPEDAVCSMRPDSVNDVINMQGMELDDHIVSKNDTPVNIDTKLEYKSSSIDGPQGFVASVFCEPSETNKSCEQSGPELQISSENHSELAKKAHEDFILNEARIIQAKRNRIAELSVGSLPFEYCPKSHWDFVLEEMMWLANDFVQESVWKRTAAAKICHEAAFASRLRFEKQTSYWSQKQVAHSMTKAVMQFWHSAELLLNSDDLKECKPDSIGSRIAGGNDVAEDTISSSNMETRKFLKLTECHGKGLKLGVIRYAVSFLRNNSSLVSVAQTEAPVTPDKIFDSGIRDMSWVDRFIEKSLFYSVPPGAMETYRKSIESHLFQCEKTGSSMREEVETSMYNVGADAGSQENTCEEDEGETSTYYLPGSAEASKQSKIFLKKRKSIMKSYNAADMAYGHCSENKIGSQQFGFVKRSVSNLNAGSIPTKRMRTASRQRVQSPFGAGTTGGVHIPAKTDASSGDTNSFQDDQSTLHGGPQIQKSLEVDSMDFEKQLTFDCTEISKPKKKKKAKHLGLAYEQRWQMDSNVQNEQRDYLKRRLENHQFEPNGNSGHHTVKKSRINKQSLDNSFDNQMMSAIPSPVASQMSNMSNSNKFVKMIGGRDRGKKSKVLKVPSGQQGSGIPWSLFEDQALVVLVHDMGPNWDLVSDCINSTLQVKCIFRKPKECKERHKILMDRSTGDGADSAEDSWSSQPYPSTLPGIPKGSARQLFQRLQGPMEEDTLKSHFEKIITIVQQQHLRKKQSDRQESKQVAPVHNSHLVALSQVCPNNQNGAPLTPLDMIDKAASNTDVVSLGYQGSHGSSVPMSSQSSTACQLPASGVNSSLPGSSGMIMGGNLSSPPDPHNGSVRYVVPRTSSVDEQHRVQQYNHMLSGRNVPQPSLPVNGPVSGIDRGRLLSGGNSMGIMGGVNRSMPMSRPGLQGVASSSMLNSGSMLSSNMMGMVSPVNMHSAAGPGQGNSILRPREAMHMMRPGQNVEHQRQMLVPEIQMQASQGNNQGVPSFSALSSGFSNQTIPLPAQTYSIHPPPQQRQRSPQHVLGSPHHSHLQGPNHASDPQQQGFTIRLAKDRQLQHQRILQHPQLNASNALMPHAQPQSQIPHSPSLQKSPQVQPQASSQPVSLPLTSSSPLTPISSQNQQKHHLLPLGLGRSPQPGAAGLTNQLGKQQQRHQQQLQQTGRLHPQQRQSSQSKHSKGIGRGSILMHQNVPIDPSHLNGLTTPAAEKREQVMQLIQGQSLYSGPCLNPAQPGHSLASPQSSSQPQQQPKLYSGVAQPLSKHLNHVPLRSDNNQGQVPPVPSCHAFPSPHQAVPPSIMASNHQQMQPQSLQRQASQSQSTVQRMLQQIRQEASDMSNKSQTEQPQVDQKPAAVSEVGMTTAMPHASTDSINVVPSVHSTSGPQRKTPEPLHESDLVNSAAQLGSVNSPSVADSTGNESIGPSVSQGLNQRQLSGSLSPHQSVGSQWQQPPQLQHRSTPTPPQHQQQQEQLHQQPSQHLQAGQSSLYIGSSNSRLE